MISLVVYWKKKQYTLQDDKGQEAGQHRKKKKSKKTERSDKKGQKTERSISRT